jgi:hypothetical protein
MKPILFLRIASALTLLHGVLHTIGGVFGSPAPGVQQGTLAMMKANHFLVMGLDRSFWKFYMGFGLGLSTPYDDDVFGSLSGDGGELVGELLSSAGDCGGVDCALSGVGDRHGWARGDVAGLMDVRESAGRGSVGRADAWSGAKWLACWAWFACE